MENKYYYNNIIAWYDFKENSKVLVLSKDNYLDEYFREKFGTKLVIIKVCDDCGYIKLNEQKIENDYDYIIMIGSYEFAPVFYNSKNPYTDLLVYLKNHLNEDGKILLTMNNKFGIKYFVGAKSKHYNTIFQSLTQTIDNTKSNLLSKNDLISAFNEADIKNYKFFYPVPDYRSASAIFSDEFLPDETTNKLSYPIAYNDESVILYSEVETLKQLANNNLFDKFCNSFFVELGKKELHNDVKFVSYNNLRKDKYNFMLVIHKNIIHKYPMFPEGKLHVKNIENNIINLKKLNFNVIDYVENDVIFSKFVPFKTLDSIITNMIKNQKIDEACNVIQNWYDYIKERLIVYKSEDYTEKNVFKLYNIDIDDNVLEKLNIIKMGFFDLVFENVFLDPNNQYLFYDQEWYCENVPIEYILYRAISNLYCYSENAINQYINFDEMLKKFEIFEYKKIFSKLEKAIQNEIIDEEKYKKYVESIPKLISLSELKKGYDDEVILRSYYYKFKDEIDNLNNNIITYNNIKQKNEKEIEELTKSIEELTKKNEEDSKNFEELKMKYDSIINSTWYKVIKKFIKIKND